ncbi:type II toxin-antitoxin system RelE/ParE family toxin [Marinomonas sp. IMCC 4694]|uniref:type II toxin-antitoxin system RelE/ParE family toxin n=1 Tax=Marinomonas sp. IMCC 4694 TaxID=2605432 RepID=UPI0011E6964C|nr:type II toxin-antitoxin system RelE/ParE family toxin [Marinomonas sp. IMCC 4694]TYL46570.1 type II toxin-antitoxin system RelE/ParE family toxin [Marinomonas sp. IMCC 4694]
MNWKINFYSGVEDHILSMPPKIQARMIKLLELMEKHGAHLGPPHTKAMGDGLFEIRAKAKEGIGRGLFCYLKGNRIYVLHVFIKKSQKTPKHELKLARERQKEVQQ